MRRSPLPFQKIASDLIALPRQTKKLMFLVQDVAYAVLALVASQYLFDRTMQVNGLLLVLVPMVALGVVTALRLPWLKLAAFDPTTVIRVGMVCVLMAAAVGLLRLLVAPGPGALVYAVLYGCVYFGLLIVGRVLALMLLNRLMADDGRTRVAIYGAGTAGIQMAAALNKSSSARPICFLDDNPNLHRLVIGGLPVGSPRNLPTLVQKFDLDEVWLTIPSLDSARRQEILNNIRDLGIKVRATPSLTDLLSGTGGGGLADITPTDLLGRESVELNNPDIARTYQGKTVMVTGAGGSIGSELCRQLLGCGVRSLILFEHSEFALYSIERELTERTDAAGVDIVARLGSVADAVRVQETIAATRPDIILHAAAYKHVPIIESNEVEGARNNIIGTRTVAEAALAAGVARMILISTDKAVRPTNIMGASKRIAEQVMQEAQTRSQTTLFSMVRFGNVLGSSGSVLPVFQRQIQSGGPVTVTHPEVTRFFMTIPEAARLVLLAGTYAIGGDVFVLDMGQPRRIVDLARQMIELSGRSVRDPVTGEGDIEIRFTGLRPGEKLYEELLISGDNLIHTPHPKIMRAQENMPDPARLSALIGALNEAIAQHQPDRVRRLIATHAEGYHVETGA